jgi:hypothetical protein
MSKGSTKPAQNQGSSLWEQIESVPHMQALRLPSQTRPEKQLDMFLSSFVGHGISSRATSPSECGPKEVGLGAISRKNYEAVTDLRGLAV